MKKVLLAGLGALALGCASMASAQGDVIAQRRAGLKRMGEYMTQMKAVADAGDEGRQFTAKIDEMIGFYHGLPALFPAGTESGDTKALPTVWSDNAGFVARGDELVTKLQVLRTSAASGSGADFQAAWRAVGPACGACHRTYRAR
jgi:cytochrome c556